MKGRYRSVAPEIVLAEARSLIEGGAKEIVLVAQDVSAYGRDLGGSIRLPKLLRDLCAIPGDFWLRIMYFYPGGFSDELLEVMAGEPKICPYLDIPLQHLDAGICAAMKRPYSDVKVWDWIERLRNAIPDIALRTTFIVGFPGEGKKEFMQLLNGLRRIRFDNVGFFPFSPQDGTPAASASDQVNERTKQTRCERLAKRQLEVAEEVNQRFVGRVVDVLIDGRFPETNLYIGHSRSQALEVDGMTRFVCETDLEPGQIVPVSISRAEGFDLIGEAQLI
jgi:ribosomal protein S12 methylthiotransferase